MKIQVLFVCLGNICRSPMAEAVFQNLVDEAGLTDIFQIDSAGTGAWHIGEPAHRGTRQVLKKQGITYNGRSRQVNDHDFANTQTYIIAMDQSNIYNLHQQFGPQAVDHPRLYRLLEFANQADIHDVPDPYYEGRFDYVYQLVKEGCAGLLATIRQEAGV